MTERTTILIVDDESKIRRLLSRSLETEGFDVAVADSAMSASEFLKNGHCDLREFPAVSYSRRQEAR